MVSLESYFQSGLSGVFTNELFIGLVLGLLVQDIRSSKYLSWERFVTEKGFYGDFKKALLYLISYIVAVPMGIIALSIIIFFLWLLSFIVG